HVVPHLLRVDQEPVHVEDDRLDHSAEYVRLTWTSAVAAVPCSSHSISPTKNVWSPASSRPTVRAPSQPRAFAIRRASSSRTRTPSQRAIGGPLVATCGAR